MKVEVPSASETEGQEMPQESHIIERMILHSCSPSSSGEQEHEIPLTKSCRTHAYARTPVSQALNTELNFDSSITPITSSPAPHVPLKCKIPGCPDERIFHNASAYK